MTSNDLSIRFVSGLRMLSKHATESFTINVVEDSGIYVGGMTPLSEDEINTLKKLRWQADNTKEKIPCGVAYYYELDYEDY